MQNISFALTTQQIRDESKDVTRRLGWCDLQPGTRLCACEKCQGLKPGELVRLAVIKVVDVRQEPLCLITPDDVRREGFPDLTPEGFVKMFLEHMRWTFVRGRKVRTDRNTTVTRIEFAYEFTKLEAYQGHLVGIWKRDKSTVDPLRCCVYCGNVEPRARFAKPCKGKVNVELRNAPIRLEMRDDHGKVAKLPPIDPAELRAGSDTDRRVRKVLLEQGALQLGDRCPHDTDGDGDCHLCERRAAGCFHTNPDPNAPAAHLPHYPAH